MAVISDSRTATEMRAEVVTELARQHQAAVTAANRGPGKGRTQKDIARDQGFASALMLQLDFWTHVWVEGKQASGAIGV